MSRSVNGHPFPHIGRRADRHHDAFDNYIVSGAILVDALDIEDEPRVGAKDIDPADSRREHVLNREKLYQLQGVASEAGRYCLLLRRQRSTCHQTVQLSISIAINRKKITLRKVSLLSAQSAVCAQ